MKQTAFLEHLSASRAGFAHPQAQTSKLEEESTAAMPIDKAKKNNWRMEFFLEGRMRQIAGGFVKNILGLLIFADVWSFLGLAKKAFRLHL